MSEDQIIALIFGENDDALKAVDHVFTVLEATYGAAWVRSVGTAPIADVKTIWAHQLSNFTHSKQAKKSIMWALRSLPEHAPNAVAFRNLCRQAPAADATLALPEPAADPARVAVELANLVHVRRPAIIGQGMKDWAHRLKARHEAGERLNPNQIRCYTEALGAA